VDELALLQVYIQVLRFLLPVIPITAPFSHVRNHRDKTAPLGATVPQSLEPLRGCRVGSDQNEDINIVHNRDHLY